MSGHSIRLRETSIQIRFNISEFENFDISEFETLEKKFD